MAYIDGFVTPVLAGRREDYRATVHAVSPLFLEHGATRVVEAYGDADVPEGKRTDFWRAVDADRAAGEGVAVSWIVWPSKEVRDAGWEKVMADERMKPSADLPFDGKRMIFGGFEPLFDSDEA